MLGLRARRAAAATPTPILEGITPSPTVVHTGFSCEGCGIAPIVGVRHRCLYWADSSGRSRNFCAACIGGPLGLSFGTSHGPFEQLHELPDPESLFDEHGYNANLGTERFHMLLQDGGQLMSAVLRYLGATDLARLQCTAQIFRACSSSIRDGLCLTNAAARDTVRRRVAPAVPSAPDQSSWVRLLFAMLPTPTLLVAPYHYDVGGAVAGEARAMTALGIRPKPGRRGLLANRGPVSQQSRIIRATEACPGRLARSRGTDDHTFVCPNPAAMEFAMGIPMRLATAYDKAKLFAQGVVAMAHAVVIDDVDRKGQEQQQGRAIRIKAVVVAACAPELADTPAGGPLELGLDLHQPEGGMRWHASVAASPLRGVGRVDGHLPAACTLSSETYDKMISNSRLTPEQREKIQTMKGRRQARADAEESSASAPARTSSLEGNHVLGGGGGSVGGVAQIEVALCSAPAAPAARMWLRRVTEGHGSASMLAHTDTELTQGTRDVAIEDGDLLCVEMPTSDPPDGSTAVAAAVTYASLDPRRPFTNALALEAELNPRMAIHATACAESTTTDRVPVLRFEHSWVGPEFSPTMHWRRSLAADARSLERRESVLAVLERLDAEDRS